MNPDYRIEIDDDGELSVIRTTDGKLMATVQDGQIKPSAPKFHQFKEEFAELLAEHERATSPMITDDNRSIADNEDPLRFTHPYGDMPKPFTRPGTKYAGPYVVESVSPKPPDNCNKMLGDICPIFISWLFLKDRAEADKRYAGRNLEAYEALISQHNGH